MHKTLKNVIVILSIAAIISFLAYFVYSRLHQVVVEDTEILKQSDDRIDALEKKIDSLQNDKQRLQTEYDSLQHIKQEERVVQRTITKYINDEKKRISKMDVDSTSMYILHYIRSNTEQETRRDSFHTNDSV